MTICSHFKNLPEKNAKYYNQEKKIKFGVIKKTDLLKIS